MADLDCWFRKANVSKKESEKSHTYFDVWMCSSDDNADLFHHPVATLVAALWAKMAARYDSLR